MPRQKKSRKIGQIGTPKTQDRVYKDKVKRKTKKGNPSGTRQQIETTKPKSPKKKVSTDPRHGSKKPISLVPQSAQEKFANPAEELAAIEADTRLSTLLDNIDQGKSLNKGQQAFVDERLARHQVLCDMLGITDEQKDSQPDSDPLQSLDAISLDDFIDSDKP